MQGLNRLQVGFKQVRAQNQSEKLVIMGISQTAACYIGASARALGLFLARAVSPAETKRKRCSVNSERRGIFFNVAMYF